MLEKDRENLMVMPSGPWHVYWQGSGPEQRIDAALDSVLRVLFARTGLSFTSSLISD